ncbi:MAG: hypothetical protein Q8P67_23850 [archaeon]|nr:hypothetical protein [archaeon]
MSIVQHRQHPVSRQNGEQQKKPVSIDFPFFLGLLLEEALFFFFTKNE